MPFVQVSPDIRIYYHVYNSSEDNAIHDDGDDDHASARRILFIMGLGASFVCWQPQIQSLLEHNSRFGLESNMQMCTMDNRGLGLSSAPLATNANYSTSIMAHDCLAVLDDLHWHHNVHIVGHSMGGMIGVKLAALAPHRVASLTVISTSAGGWDALLPRSWRQFKMGWKMMMARDEDTRTKRTLKAHFTKEMLDELEHDAVVGRRARHAILHQEYTTMAKTLAPTTINGSKGQFKAVWTHNVAMSDIQAIHHGGFPCLVIHGRHDIVTPPACGQRLAVKLKCPLVLLEGAHFLTRDQAPAVNQLLAGVVFGEAFHHRPHYQFILGDAHVPPSYTAALDTHPNDLSPHEHVVNGGGHGGE